MVPSAPATRQGQERREAILATAVEVFGEAGFAGARVDEIARRVGIQRPSLLYHFPDKRTLYAAAIDQVLRDLTTRFQRAGDHPTERLEAIADAWVDFMITRPSAARLLLRQMLDAIPLDAADRTGKSPERRREGRSPVGGLLAPIRAAMDERTLASNEKSMDATELALILSSTSLVWFASRNAIEGAFGLDTLSPEAVQRHRRTLHSLIRKLLRAADEPAEGPRSDPRPAASRRRFPPLLVVPLVFGLLASPLLPWISTAETSAPETRTARQVREVDLSIFEGHWQRIEDPALDEERVSAIERALSGLSWIVRRVASGILRKSTVPPDELQFSWTGEALEQEVKGVEGPEKRPILLDGQRRRALDARGVPFASTWDWSEEGLRLHWEQHQATGNNLYRVAERGDLLVVRHTIQVTALSDVEPIVFESRFIRDDLSPRASLEVGRSRSKAGAAAPPAR
ncbi:MAG TPA: TetR family transcriptional regulator [Deltaproteobacteria bacterium]|nr:TetR family transcriptional regulator [Deltaproteobacteria bacterium]